MTLTIPWTEIGMFWATVAVAFITVAAVVVNYLFFRAQIDPDVIVYASHDERRPSIITLVIENIGKSTAKNVKFEPSQDIPSKAFGFADAPIPQKMADGPLITGIPALGPDTRRIITWGQYGGLSKGLGQDVIRVNVSFESDRRPRFLGTRKHRNTCLLDIKSFEGTDASDHNWDKKSAEQLQRIADVLDRASSAYKAIKIESGQNKDEEAT